MSRDIILFIDDILNSIDKIEKYIEGFDYKTFQEDAKTQDAVIRNLEIIGEAAKSIIKYFQPDETIFKMEKDYCF